MEGEEVRGVLRRGSCTYKDCLPPPFSFDASNCDGDRVNLFSIFSLSLSFSVSFSFSVGVPLLDSSLLGLTCRIIILFYSLHLFTFT